VIASDRQGTGLIVYGSEGEALDYPQNLVAKRYEKRQTDFIIPIDEIRDFQFDRLYNRL
jgi:hypothetical protein